MLFDILLIVIGFVFLVLGADVLVKGCSNIAKKFHIPEVIIGLTIVAIGTSMPEIIITIDSAVAGHADLIIGNAIGSNLCNILLILGLISLIRPVEIENETKRIHIPAAIISTILVMIIGNGLLGTGKFIITKIEGFILLGLSIIYFSLPIVTAIKDIRKTQCKEETENNKISTIKAIINIILGIILLKYGSDFVVDNSIKLAEEFNVSQRVIGLTIIAIGTALPELITSIVASIKKDTDMAVRKFNWFVYI